MWFCNIRAAGDVILYFCLWAWYLLYSNSRRWIDIIWLQWLHIGGSVFFNRYSCAVFCSKSCHNYSIFSFQVIGRHYLVEILGYFMCFCFLRCSIFCSMIIFRHGVMLQWDSDKEFVFGWHPTRISRCDGIEMGEKKKKQR